MSEYIGPAIELQHLTRRFGNKTVVNDLSMTIAPGSTFGFIGLNGAGKTTTIRMIVGLLAPNSGTIRVADHDVPSQRDRIKWKIGYVPDRPNVYSWMRVGEAISFCKSFYLRWNDDYVAELLRTFQLDLTKRVKHLSKGMAAKLQLLLALGHEPEILILDEPMSGLDPLVREEFLKGLIAAVAERKQTVLFSSHTLSDVQRLADSIGLLHEGRLLVHSPIDQLLEKTKRIRAVLKDSAKPGEIPPGVLLQKVTGREWMLTVENFSRPQVEFLREKNSIESVEVQDLSLDDVFKDYVKGRLAREAV
jgi:ABC-2 type transport system ATP-binding protein